MSDTTLSEQLDPDLTGVRVGLSGAIPDQTEWAGRALDWEILNAVSTLADTVFSGGGTLVHGSHPSFTPRILAQAAPYAEERGEPVVTFVLSGLFADGAIARQLEDPRYQGVVDLILVDPVIPPGHEGHGAEDPAVRNASLTAMRERLVQEMDAMVIIGGKRWADSANKPGTAEELELARARGIPCYPLGGLGGMAQELAEQPDYQVLAAAEAEDPMAQEDSAKATNTWSADDEAPLEAIATRGVRTFTATATRTLEARTATMRRPTLSQADDALIRATPDYGRAIGIIAKHLRPQLRRD